MDITSPTDIKLEDVSGPVRPKPNKKKGNEPVLMTIDSFIIKLPLPLFTWPRC